MSANKSNHHYEILKAQNIERIKELETINKTTNILKENKTVEETLQRIARLLPHGWQYPEFTCCRILYDGTEYISPDFVETTWVQKQSFETIDDKKGFIEIYYTKNFPKANEGPFLKEERDLITNIGQIIAGWINGVKAHTAYKRYPLTTTPLPQTTGVKTDANLQLLQRYLNQNNYDRDLYHDLMPFKVQEILLIANLYDAYIIEKEGHFSDEVMGEYATLNLSSVPRITGVSTEKDAIDQLNSKHYDMIIIMVGVDKKTPILISRKIKKLYPYIPVFLLLNNNKDIALYEKENHAKSFDRLFVWNGESRIFFAITKYVEDYINLENDTHIGLVRVMLLVEDSPDYYSRYLPMLYQILLEQTRRIIDDVSTDERYKVLRLRARPKILLASNYEEAINIYKNYKDYIFCLITDVKYEVNGVKDDRAGFKLVRQIRDEKVNIPVIIQSSNDKYSDEAYQLKSTFINKNSETLSQEFKSFIMHYLGFGNFIYRNKYGKKLVEVKSLKEFEKHLKTIPDESILYHGRKDHFSLWLMARGEIQAAKVLHPKKTSDFKNAEAIRNYLVNVIAKFRYEQNQGKVIPFEESAIYDETNIVTLVDGPLGGKGRGLAFINSLIYSFNFSQQVKGINICTPKTSIIGTDEFEYFFDRNELHYIKTSQIPYDEIKRIFLKSKLTPTLIKRLKSVIKIINKPLAIRSSSLFEDSLMQPFAGIFETYILPNNHPDPNVKLQQLMDAIKLVYASVYSDVAREYFKAVNYKIEEEKMAIILQEVVGNRYGNVFYPHISGVAQSYNYYPVSHMKPEEGFAVAALGLGKYVVEGELAYRFSPKYPNVDILSTEDQLQNSQVHFYAVDLNNHEPDLLKGDMAGLTTLEVFDAEKHGTLKHCASTFDANNNMIYPGIHRQGPRIINFSNILKFNYIPLSKAISFVLDVVKEAMGSPVEIEFAVDLNKDIHHKASFYVLQIKPMIGNKDDYQVDPDSIPREETILYAEKGMGNGLVDYITDFVYVDNDQFDKAKTEEMAREIDHLNTQLKGKKYVLIGPGRWGTRDRWIGIPVEWPQISNAKIIVETSLEGYPLESSSGSHFFHNVTSANVGYFSVYQEKTSSYINYDILEKQELITKTAYFRHVRFKEPVMIRMDGKKRIAVISLK